VHGLKDDAEQAAVHCDDAWRSGTAARVERLIAEKIGSDSIAPNVEYVRQKLGADSR